MLHFESPPLARIMTPLDVVKDIGPGLGSRPVILPIHPLTFEHAKEALGHGVVGTAPHRTHAADDLVCFQELLVFLGGKLTASIRVQNDRGAATALPVQLEISAVRKLFASPRGRKSLIVADVMCAF